MFFSRAFLSNLFFFSVFVQREVNKSSTHRILVGNQRGKTTLGCGFLSFFFFLVTILYCSDIFWSKDLSAYFFCFLSILDQESFLLLLFCFLPLVDWEFSFLFFFFFSFFRFLPLFDWEFFLLLSFDFLIGNFPLLLCFLLRERFMVCWDYFVLFVVFGKFNIIVPL